MKATTSKLPKDYIVRRYNIKGESYIVKATIKSGATEDAAAKVRRLIRNDFDKQSGESDS